MDVKAFFDKKDGLPEGTARNVNLVLESIERCVQQRAVMREPLREYLKESLPLASS